MPPDPATECCATCLASGASGCLVLENMDCWCLYTGGGGDGGTRNIDTNDDLGSMLRVAPEQPVGLKGNRLQKCLAGLYSPLSAHKGQ
ncbi:MAG: hypothetical protein ABI270_05905 [Nitrosospira sp.]